MSKQHNNTTVVSVKQQVSKVMLGQMIADAEGIASCKYDCIDRRISTIKRSISYNLINSGYHKNHSLASWSSEHFEMRFEYGRRGGCRVSYMNNQGLQSATFQASEWNCMMSYLKRKVDGIIDRLHYQEEEEQRKAEQERFQRAVENAILEDIAKGKDSRIRNAIEIEDAIHHCHCQKVEGEKRKQPVEKAKAYCVIPRKQEDDFVEV